MTIAITVFALVLILAIGSISLIRSGELGKLQTILLRLCLEAEREFGGGTGTIKFADVLSKLYPLIPGLLKPFISEAQLSKLVDAALAVLNRQLATNLNVAKIVRGE
ncbi:MAG: hypothetical protein LBN97_04945 [Oscillospiraceae bacterium]|jgi:hypothetical protein|nr:hypothetical protein [Oscillospiraceae bacterium]